MKALALLVVTATAIAGCQGPRPIADLPVYDDLLLHSEWMGRRSPCGTEAAPVDEYLAGFEDASVTLSMSDTCGAGSATWSAEARFAGSDEIVCLGGNHWFAVDDAGHRFLATLHASGQLGSEGTFRVDVYDGRGLATGVLLEAGGAACHDYGLVLRDW